MTNPENYVSVGPFPKSVHPAIQDALYQLQDALRSGKYNATFEAPTFNSFANSPHDHHNQPSGGPIELNPPTRGGTQHLASGVADGKHLTATGGGGSEFNWADAHYVGVKCVGGGARTYTTIQSAINAAYTAWGSDPANQVVILIDPGTYTENITTKAYIHLVGNGAPGSIIVSASTENAHTFTSNTFIINVLFDNSATSSSSTDTFQSASSCHIRSDAPTTNYHNGDGTKIALTGSTFRGIVGFDLSSIPAGSTITSATLYWYVTDANTGTQQYHIYSLLRNYADTQATWNIFSTGNSWGTAGANNASTDYTTTSGATPVDGTHTDNHWMSTSVTDLANLMLTSGNYNLRFDCDVYVQFSADGQANEPYLSVTYNQMLATGITSAGVSPIFIRCKFTGNGSYTRAFDCTGVASPEFYDCDWSSVKIGIKNNGTGTIKLFRNNLSCSSNHIEAISGTIISAYNYCYGAGNHLVNSGGTLNSCADYHDPLLVSGMITYVGTVKNADTVDTLHASATPTANYLYPLNASAVYPHEVGGLEADVSAYNGILKIASGSTSSITDNSVAWNLNTTHRTNEDAINGLVKCNGAGTYSAITDSSTNWNTAYGWGDHSTAGYLLSSSTPTLANLWTFQTFPVTPSSAPTTNYQVANKKYVDDSVSGAGGGNVSAGANLTDNKLVRGDGGTTGVQTSLVDVDDAGSLNIPSSQSYKVLGGDTGNWVQNLSLGVTSSKTLNILAESSGTVPSATNAIRILVPLLTNSHFRQDIGSYLSGAHTVTMADAQAYWGRASLNGSKYTAYLYAIWDTTGFIWALARYSGMDYVSTTTTITDDNYFLLEDSSTYTRNASHRCMCVGRITYEYDTSDTPDFTIDPTSLRIIWGRDGGDLFFKKSTYASSIAPANPPANWTDMNTTYYKLSAIFPRNGTYEIRARFSYIATGTSLVNLLALTLFRLNDAINGGGTSGNQIIEGGIIRVNSTTDGHMLRCVPEAVLSNYYTAGTSKTFYVQYARATSGNNMASVDSTDLEFTIRELCGTQ